MAWVETLVGVARAGMWWTGVRARILRVCDSARGGAAGRGASQGGSGREAGRYQDREGDEGDEAEQHVERGRGEQVVADQRLRYEEDRGVQKAEDEGDPADAAVLR